MGLGSRDRNAFSQRETSEVPGTRKRTVKLSVSSTDEIGSDEGKAEIEEALRKARSTIDQHLAPSTKVYLTVSVEYIETP